jgi:polysaccharide pyruvyl transferase WcaK-like protein
MCVIQDPIEPVASILSRHLSDRDAEACFGSGLLLKADGTWRDTFLRRFRVYFDAATWMHELRMHDLAVGTKFHGNMLAFQAGTPAIFIMHDTRTEELANALLLPRISKEVFLSANSLDDVLKLKTFDSLAYAKRREAIGRKYTECLARTGIEVSTELLAMAGIGR